MNGENQPLLTNELVEFELQKWLIQIRNLKKITTPSRISHGIFLDIIKKPKDVNVWPIGFWNHQDLDQLCPEISRSSVPNYPGVYITYRLCKGLILCGWKAQRSTWKHKCTWHVNFHRESFPKNIKSFLDLMEHARPPSQCNKQLSMRYEDGHHAWVY